MKNISYIISNTGPKYGPNGVGYYRILVQHSSTLAFVFESLKKWGAVSHIP